MQETAFLAGPALAAAQVHEELVRILHTTTTSYHSNYYHSRHHSGQESPPLNFLVRGWVMDTEKKVGRNHGTTLAILKFEAARKGANGRTASSEAVRRLRRDGSLSLLLASTSSASSTAQAGWNLCRATVSTYGLSLRAAQRADRFRHAVAPAARLGPTDSEGYSEPWWCRPGLGVDLSRRIVNLKREAVQSEGTSDLRCCRNSAWIQIQRCAL
eukprot:1683229-Rhodomonas_salina.1